MSAARVGKTEAGRTAICYWIDQAPGPALIVYPTEDACEEQVVNELTPLLEQTPTLQRHLTGRKWDLRVKKLETSVMRIYSGWPGAPNTLAYRTIRYALADEVDKYPPFSGREASPLALIRTRMETFRGRSKYLITSTPTNPEGAIAREWEQCRDRRYYHVPCPHCGALQKLVWRQVRWKSEPDEERLAVADRVEVEQGAWYECIECGEAIYERDKARMLQAETGACWVSEGYEPGGHPGSRRRGYHLSTLYSLLGFSWSDMAAQFLRARQALEMGDIGPLMEFITQRLGEPFEDQVDAVTGDEIQRKAEVVEEGLGAGEVPAWATAIMLTVDTQKTHFKYIVRAHAHGRSRKLAHGSCAEFRDLEILEQQRWPVQGSEAMASVRYCLIDCGGGTQTDEGGNRTDQVYEWVRQNPVRRFACKGVGGKVAPRRPVTVTQIDHVHGARGRAKKAQRRLVAVHMVDTQHFKDLLAGLISSHSANWHPGQVDADYVAEMRGEHKVLERRGGANIRRVWKKRKDWGRVDYWDGEVLQLVGAWMFLSHEEAGAPTLASAPSAKDWFAARRAARAGKAARARVR
jgi:phage terminase large subunit GpA-like protein